MLEKASALMGVALPAEQLEDEIVAVEDEPLGLGDLIEGEDEPISLTESDAREAQSGQAEEALVVDEVEEVEVEEEKPGGDDDLEMFDKAFDSLGGPAATAPSGAAGESAAAPVITPPPPPAEISAPADDAMLDSLAESVGSDLEERVAELEQKLAEREAELEQAKKAEGSSSSLLKLKEAKNKAEKEVLRLKEELNAKEKELVELQEQQTALEGEAQQLKDDAVKREAAAKALQQRADALAAAAKKFERELTAAREEAKKSNKSAELEKQLAKLQTELNELKGEKELLVEERDELKKQLEESQVTAVANEDRAVKAYQKIKNDEKLRDKTRKALEIALQLLQENADGEETDGAAKKSA
jgi:DNA repair exonuclease SbcCD ATPase subunit